MKRLTFLLFLLLLSNTVFAQKNIKISAEKMGAALMSKDYKTFVNYSYPKIMKEMGGREKMAETIAQQIKGIEEIGAKIISLNYGTPSIIIKEKNELQATIPQEMILQTPQGKVLAKSTLITISTDNGANWYFVDAGERDIATIRISLPNISKSLTLPTPEPPQLIEQ